VESGRTDARFVLISLGSGLFTGVLAGLVGLGGAEERIPFILYAIRVPLNDAIVANLIISFATSAVNFTLRVQAGFVTLDAITIGAAMIVGSLMGAYAGSVLSHRLSERRLKAAIALILSLVVVRLVLDLLGGVSFSFGSIPSILELPTAAFFGLLVGVISGAVGVAGGEYRIPVLVFLFGLGIKVAGTTSQLVSLPTVIVALWKHKAMGFVTREGLRVAAAMGTGSVVGAAIGSVILVSSSGKIVELVFILLLLYTIARLLLELRTRVGLRGNVEPDFVGVSSEASERGALCVMSQLLFASQCGWAPTPR